MLSAWAPARRIPFSFTACCVVRSKWQHLQKRAFVKTQPSFTQNSTVEVPEFSHLQSHDDVYDFSIREPDAFWGTLAKSRLIWDAPFETASDCDFAAGKINWFLGGKLNASVQCLDRHIPARGDQAALIWEGDEPGQVQTASYRELLSLTCRAANVLKAHGVKFGDRVVIYMPSSILAAAMMQACTRIGAVHAVVFAGFSPESLATRISDSGAEILVTVDAFSRGGSLVPVKQLANAAVNSPTSGGKIRHVLMSRRVPNYADYPSDSRDVDLDAELERASDICPPVPVPSEHPLYLLYTSGSTGRPKGLLHTTAGYLLHTDVAQRSVFGVRDGDVFGCMADVGWLVGHTMTVYGSLLVGGTGFLTETTPTYPDAGRYWDMTQRHRSETRNPKPEARRSPKPEA
jgi:acetyl-CoA synthetase